ncbi:MAG: hypothetical protein AAGI15_11600, partial [Pseudomonadota bacterium]
VAVSNEGPNLFANTLPAVPAMGWQGQFHLDFVTYLVLSGLWVAWRHRFSGLGIVLGLAASQLGMIFLSIYLLIVISRNDGDLHRVLLGEQAASAS